VGTGFPAPRSCSHDGSTACLENTACKNPECTITPWAISMGSYAFAGCNAYFLETHARTLIHDRIPWNAMITVDPWCDVQWYHFVAEADRESDVSTAEFVGAHVGTRSRTATSDAGR
jgi:hypothetical protein